MFCQGQWTSSGVHDYRDTHPAPPLCPWSWRPLWPRCPGTSHPGVLLSGWGNRTSSDPPLPSRWNTRRSLWSPCCPGGGPGGFQSRCRSLWCTHTCCPCLGPWATPWTSGTRSITAAAPRGTGTWLEEQRRHFVVVLHFTLWGKLILIEWLSDYRTQILTDKQTWVWT